jgi:hypothetical protein
MRLRAVKLYGDGVYHLYDDKHLYCPFIQKHGLDGANEYTIKMYNDPTVCKYCTDNFKQMAFRGLITIPPSIPIKF